MLLSPSSWWGQYLLGIEHPIQTPLPCLGRTPPPGGPFPFPLSRLLANPQQLSTLDAPRVCVEIRRKERERQSYNCTVRAIEESPLHSTQYLFHLWWVDGIFSWMIYHLSGSNFFKNINILGGLTLLKQWPHQYSPKKEILEPEQEKGSRRVKRKKYQRKRSALGNTASFASILAKHTRSYGHPFNSPQLPHVLGIQTLIIRGWKTIHSTNVFGFPL